MRSVYVTVVVLVGTHERIRLASWIDATRRCMLEPKKNNEDAARAGCICFSMNSRRSSHNEYDIFFVSVK